MPETRGANVAEFSVSELSGALKRTLEDTYGYVRVRGEVSGYRGAHSSGHCYFALKDAGAKLEAVIWKGTFGRMKIRPDEGMEVIATGRITTFPGKSSYQIVIDTIEPAGIGALLAQLEERKRRLQSEGLFDPARKRPIPYLPRVIGVITSPTGAVIRDILHRLRDRFPRHVLLWPVRVQGDTAAAEIIAALDGFNASGSVLWPRPDVLIVARGGGSLEDLWGFNDEALARAVVRSAIPVIAAVGHETDWTLIDYVADVRAPTPTGAAEMAVPVRADLLAGLASLHARERGATRRLLDRQATTLRALARVIARPDRIVQVPRQRLDTAAVRLQPSLRQAVRERRMLLGQLARRLERCSPRLALLTRRGRLDALTDRAGRAFPALVARKAQRLQALGQLLNSVSYTAVLNRGFALVRDAADQPLRSAQAATAGQALTVQFADGRLPVTVGAGAPAGAAGRRHRQAPGTTAQDDLFGN
jgi:exodeoxyribonuclease VII large subunit